MLSAGSKKKNGYLPHIWVKWVHNPCRLWGLQISLVGQEPYMATLPSCGQSGYITASGVHNAQRGG